MLPKHSLIYFTSRAIAAAAMCIAIFAYTRLLSPAEYGMYALASSSVSLTYTMTMLWICLSGLRLLNAAKNNSTLRAGLLANFLMILAALSAAAVIMLWLMPHPEQRLLVGLSVVMLAAFGWLELNLHLLMAEAKPGEYGWINVVRTVGGATLGIYFAYSGWGAFGVLCGTILGMLVPSMWFTLKYWRGVDLRLLDSTTLRDLAAYGLPLTVGLALYAFACNADRLLIAVLMGTPALGLYAIGFEIANRLMNALMSPIGSAGISLAIQALEERRSSEAALQQLSENIILLLGIGFPAAVGLAIVADDLAATIVGPEYRNVAATTIPLVAFSSLLAGLRANYVDHAFQLGHRTVRQSILMLAIAILSGFLNLWWIGEFGVVGAAYAILATHTLGLGLAYLLSRDCFPLPFPILEFAKIMAATAIMAWPVSRLDISRGSIQLLLQVLLGMTVYIVAGFSLDIGGYRTKILKRYRRI